MIRIHNTHLTNNKDALKLLNKEEPKLKTQTNATLQAQMNGPTCEAPNFLSGYSLLSV